MIFLKAWENCRIIIRSNSRPYALTTPRRVAAPLMSKVKAELQRMEKLGVISKIEEPTVCCSPKTKRKSPNMCRLNKTQ